MILEANPLFNCSLFSEDPSHFKSNNSNQLSRLGFILASRPCEFIPLNLPSSQEAMGQRDVSYPGAPKVPQGAQGGKDNENPEKAPGCLQPSGGSLIKREGQSAENALPQHQSSPLLLKPPRSGV